MSGGVTLTGRRVHTNATVYKLPDHLSPPSTTSTFVCSRAFRGAFRAFRGAFRGFRGAFLGHIGSSMMIPTIPLYPLAGLLAGQDDLLDLLDLLLPVVLLDSITEYVSERLLLRQRRLARTKRPGPFGYPSHTNLREYSPKYVVPVFDSPTIRHARLVHPNVGGLRGLGGAVAVS